MGNLNEAAIRYDESKTGEAIDRTGWVQVNMTAKLAESNKPRITVLAQDDNSTAIRINFVNGEEGTVTVLKNGGLIQNELPTLTHQDSIMLRGAIETALDDWLENPFKKFRKK